MSTTEFAHLAPDELKPFMRAAEKIGERWRLAFMVSVNAMLWPRETLAIKGADLVRGDPCHLRVLGVGSRQRTVPTDVDLNRETIDALQGWMESQQIGTGRLFVGSETLFKLRFKEALKSAGLFDHKPSALRSTGIYLRVLAAKDAVDLAYICRCARLKSVETLNPYIPKAHRDDILKRTRWA